LDYKLSNFVVFWSTTDSSFVPPLIYAVMGSSRDIVIGPVTVVSLMLETSLHNEIDQNTHPTEYRRLAFTATFFAGITQATIGVFRYETLVLCKFTFEFF
jgi:high affinity sulfate transporter 1